MSDELIGFGRMADVFAVGHDRVVRRYRNPAESTERRPP
jgi:hypothetical protein